VQIPEAHEVEKNAPFSSNVANSRLEMSVREEGKQKPRAEQLQLITRKTF